MEKTRKEYKDLDVESKIAKALHKLRNTRPFYSAIYEAMKRVEDSEKTDTMAVSVDTIYYNSEFIDSLEFEEFMFVNMHEVTHVALMHTSRINDRDGKLWNIACDLYVNKLLSEELEIKPGETTSDGNFKFQEHGLYCSSIDLDRESADDIYSEFYLQAKENGYLEDKKNNKISNKKYYFTYTGKDRTGNRYYDKFETCLRLKENKYGILKSNEDAVLQETKNKAVLSEAKTRCEMNNKNFSDGKGNLVFRVNQILKSHVDWRKLLRKYCIKSTSTDSSFATPDKRMYYQRAIYPNQSLDISYTIKGVKVCFDSSGSISNKEMAYFYGQVRDILKDFKIEAELLYWDTDVESSGNFMDIKEMRHISAIGRGGTDPKCLFEYFDSKKCKVKPVVTLIFTDGYLPPMNIDKPKWRRKYKDTIWIMTKDHCKSFKPSFGKVTLAKFSN